MTDKTGGSAFPRDNMNAELSGMTLRDYFAGQAISGLSLTDIPEKTAHWAYALADAMLKRREG